MKISRALQPWRHYTVVSRGSYITYQRTHPQVMFQASDIYKVRLATLIFKINSKLAPQCMEFITKSRSTTHNLRNANNLAIPFPNSYYMKGSIAYRGAVIWNLLSPLANGTGIKAFTKKASQSSDLGELNFSAESPSTIQHMDTDFVLI